MVAIRQLCRGQPGTCRRYSRAGSVRCRCSNQPAYETLDRAVQTLNKLISARGPGPNASPQDAALAAARPRKLVAFSSFADMTKALEDTTSPSKSLQSYLALPIDEYSLLDPRWITRGDADGVFHLQLPLFDLVGIDLTPGVTIHVDVDAEQSQVRFTATQFSSGEPSLDAEFSVNMLAVLAAGDVQEVHVAGAASAGPGAAAAGRPASSTKLLQTLKCSVNVTGSLNVPHPLAIAPRPLLASLGSLLLRLVLQALLPNFMDLLLVDYRRWVDDSTARDQPAGSLMLQ